MAKTYKVIVNTGKEQADQTIEVVQGAGDRGQPVRIKAQAGAKYQLQEMERQKQVAPDGVKVKRVGKDLWLMFEEESQPSVVLEDYYDVMPEGYNGVVGQAEDGLFYEYIPEDPKVSGLVSELAEGGQAVNVALGGVEVSGAGAALGVVAFPLLGALGVLGGIGAAGALAYQTLNKDGTANQAGDLAPASDSGQSNTDNLTNNKTNLVVQGQATPGSTVDVMVKNSSGTVVYQGKVTADADGNYNYTVPGPLPDGVYTPYTGETQGKPFTIDTVTRVDITDAGRVGTMSPISGTAEPGGTVVVKDINGQVLGTVVANAQGVWQITPTTPVPAGAITAEVTDPAGNKANDSDMPVGLGIKTALSLDPISGDNVLLASESGATTLPVTGKVTGAFKEGDVVNLTLNGKNYAASVGADGRFSVPVAMADLKADPDTKIEARITGTNGDTATAAQDYTVEASNTPAQTALSVDPVTADNILSAAENTGNVPITGQATGKFTAGDAVTVSVNGKTFTGTVAADGKFSINVPAADLAADPDTQLEARLSGTGGVTAQAIQDYALDTTTPKGVKTALSLDPISGDNVLLASESGATTLPVTGKVTGTFSAGDVVNLSLNGKTYAASVAADGSFSVNVAMADLKADPDTKIEATITGTNGDTATAAQDYTVEAGNTPAQTALSVDPVTADNVLSATEKSGNVAITGQATGKFAAGDAVTVSVNGKTFTGTVAADGKFSINVPGTDLAADPDTQLEARITGTGGTTAQAIQDYALSASAGGDRNADLPPTGNLAPGSDSGLPGDRVTNDTTPEIIGQVPVGATATITLNGKTYPVTVAPDGSYTFTQPDGLPDGTYTPVLTVTKNGQTTETPIDSFTIDTVPPSVAIAADKIQLLAGQTSTITFTLSEAVSDFSAADITVSGGTLGNLVQSQTDPKVYTAVFTPNASSTTTSVISVASGRFSDAANNFNTDGAEANNTVSLPTNTRTPGGTAFLAPTSDTGTSGDNRTNDNTPAIAGQVTPGSTAVVNINGRDYPVDVKPDGSYTFTVPTSLPDGTYVPKIIITPAGSSTPNPPQDGTPFTIDTVAPTVLVSSDKATLATGQTATITFTLSEDSTDFTLADVAVTGGKLSNLQGSGKVYTATFTPSANSTTTSTVKVDSFKFSDAAGNFNTDGADTGVGNTNIVSMPTNTAQADTTAPTIALSADRTSLATGQTTVVTFTLSEASSDFTLADVTATGGTLANLVQSQTDPKIYTAVFTPNASSTTPSVISVASNKFSDAAGNFNADGADANNTLSLPTNTMPAQTSGQLQPSSDSGTKGDNKTLDNTPAYGGTAPAGSKVEVEINGKTYTTVADSNGQYTVVVPDALPDGTYVPKIIVTPAGSSTPNAPQDGTPFTIDTTPPTVVVSSDKATLATGQTATISFTLSEASTDFSLADVEVTGGTLSNFAGSGTSYTATFTPTAQSTQTSVVHVASNKFADAAGNVNTDGTDTNNTVSMVTNTVPANVPANDTTAPTIIVTRSNPGVSLAANASETINFTLSEPSATFGLSDVTVTGGTLSNFTAIPSSGTAGTGYTQYTATFTPAAGSAGTATVGVAAGTFSDNAGNLNADTFVQGTGYQSDNLVSLAYNTVPADTTPPTVAVSRAGTGSLTQGGSETITFVLSEASTTFNLSDIDVSGGTLSNFAPLTTSGNASTGYTDYTATFTPNANALGTATIGVASGRFTDASNNANLDTYLSGVAGTSLEANNLVNIDYNTQLPDTTAPTIIVSRASAGTVSGTETIYFTLSEASTTFTLSDVDVTGGNLSSFVPVATSGNSSQGYTQYMATFTPTANAQGNATIGVSSAKFADAAGNLNADTYVSGTGYETNNLVSLAYNTLVPDTTPPTIAISRTGSGVVTGTETVSFKLSEASSNFTLADIDVTGGTLSNFQPVSSSGSVSLGYTEFTATFTPTANTLGTGSVGVLSGKFTDAASNTNTDTYLSGVAGTTQEGNNLVAFAINTDTTAPTVVVSRTSSGTVTGSETINFTLSEASTDFALADITVTGGTLSNFQGSGTSYTATFTPTPGTLGTATIGVLSAKFADAAGNLNKDTFSNPASGSDVYEANNLVSLPVNTDNTPPTIVVSRSGSGTLSSAETISFTLSEASSSFDVSDVIVSGGTLSNFAPVSSSGNNTSGYTQYTATFTPTANSTGTATVGVASDKFADAAGNLNKDTYLAGVTGTTQEANNQVSMAFNTQAPDTTAPTVVVSRSAAGLVNGTEVINFTLSEASTDFTLADITVTGGTLSNFTGSGSTYSATFTPTADAVGTGTVGVASDKFADAAGNRNLDTFVAGNLSGTITESNNQVSLPYNTDTTAPTVVVARTGSGTVSGAGETIQFTLSEASSNFTLADIDVTGGTLSNFVQDSINPRVYSALFTPSSNGVGVATVGVASSKFSDAAGNLNADTYLTGVSNTTVESNNQVSFNYSNDTAAPTIAISSNQASLTAGQTATITFTLSEASSDFTAGDIEVSGGSLGALTHVGVNSSGQDVYTAVFTPTANSTTPGVVRVASDKFSDAAGNLNKDTYASGVSGTTQEANNSVSLTVNTVSTTFAANNDSATAKEVGVQNGGNTAEAGTNPSTTTQAAGVLGNDTDATSVTHIAASGGSNSAVSSGSTGASNGTSVTGQYGTLVMGANGTYTYTLNNSNGTVNALQAGSSLSDVFTYTARDASGATKTANLTVTINGTNDAPTVALPLVDQTGIEVGNAVNYTFDSGTFADVDTADTKSYTATMADGTALPNWLTFDAATRTFSGTPPAVGLYSVKVIATDARGATISDEFNIAVIASRNAVVADTKTALTIEPVTGDNVILNSENTGNITLTGQVTGTFVEGDIVTLLINGTNYTAAAAANGRYSVSVLASDLAADADKQVIGSVNGTGGDLGTAAQRYVLETGNTATKTALSIDPVTADNVVLSSEAVAGKIAVTGKVTGVFATGDIVTLTIKNVTYTAAAAANGRFSVEVDFTDLEDDTDTTVDGTVTGTGGTVATATQDYALVDEAPPKIAITRSGSGTNTGAETITFTLTEASSNFVQSDVDVTGGALSNWTAVSGTVYTATFTPTANNVGTASVGVLSDKFSDAGGNLNKDTYLSGVSGTTQESNNQISFNTNTDTTAPTVVVTRASSGTVSGTETITFTLSEASSDFTQADVFVTSGAGTLSNWTAVSGTVYTATFTPTANSAGSVTIGVASDKFADAGGNLNKDTYLSGVSGTTQESNNSVVFDYNTDTTAPTVVVTRAGSGTVSGTETITFTLSEASSDFTQADVFVTSGAGTLSNWTAVSGTVYTATFTPTANSAGSVTIGVASDKFADAGGNLNKDTYLSGVSGTTQESNNSVVFDYNTDTTAPTVVVTRAGSGTVSGTETITFTLSEASSDFTQADVFVTSGAGTLSNWTAVSGTVYTATFTPTANSAGSVTIGVASDKFADAGGNLNKDTYLSGVSGTTQESNNSVVFDYNTDTTAPTVVVTRAGSGTVSGTETITFTLSEASSDFTQADVFVTSGAGTLSNWTAVSGTVYTATFTPTANSAGSVTIGVASDKFADAGGNLNKDTYLSGVSGTTQESNNSVVFDTDTLAPTQTVSFSSMTKDTGLGTVTTSNTSSNANWTTADGSAGRLVSGAISAALNAGEVVEVYVNKGAGPVKIGNATVSGTHWVVTDHTSYVSDAAWTYSAKVVDAAGNAGTTQTRNVISDYVEAAPVITAVIDSASITVATNSSATGTTTNALKTVSGTGTAGSTIYVYDNSQTNLVGTAVVDGSGNWTATITGAGAGANTFAAVALDNVGNTSVLSNLVTVTAAATNGLSNGDFSAGNTGFISELNKVSTNPIIGDSNSFNVGTIASLSNTAVPVASNVTTTTNSTATAYSFGTWAKRFVGSGGANFTAANPDGTMSGSILMGQISTAGEKILWQSNVDVVAGQTYTFSFDYFNSQFVYGSIPSHEMGTTIDGQYIQFVTNPNEAGHFTATYVATSTKTITLDINAASWNNQGSGGDFALDNLKFTPSLATNDNTLVAGQVFGGATANADGALGYSDGSLTALAGNDVITVSNNQLQAKLAAGGYIDGDAGVDTLKLATGTVLDLDQLTRNQTVKSIQEVEIFQLQGGSTLSMSANDVLSLGGSNASTMSGFSFSSTTAGSGAGFNSTDKVQFVVQGTNTDQVKLVPLQLDGVLNGAGELGNTGLAGQWTDIGLTTIGGVTYQVYNHSTTQAQVLVSNATVQLPTNAQTVAITSAAINSTSFVQEFVAPQVATSKAQKSVTTDDGNWTISATGANGQTLQTIDANNNNVGYYVSIGDRWSALPGTELNLGEQTTQQISGGRREYTFTSNAGTFDFVAFNYTDVNFTNDLWINFYNAAGQLIDRTAFTAVNVNNSFFTYDIKGGALATSFMIDMNTDDTWGLDKLTTGVKQSAAEVFSGASIMDATPLLKGTYSANLAANEVIAVYDGATKLGNAVIDANTKTWSYQTTSNLSAAAHTFTAKVETSGGTATATSSNFSLNVLSSPLALDLNGDGVQTMGIEQGVQFDLLATGSAQNVGWLDGQDGWLALDLDDNGRIDSGAELLGSSTRLADGSLARDGWQALAQHDGNADGVIDVRDEVFLDLKVWVDANSNGQTEAGELRSLADLQIVSLDLNHAGGEIAQNGNILQGLSSFTTADGESHQMVDAWLKVDQVLNTADAAEATADAAPAGEVLHLNQLLSAAPPAGAITEVMPVVDSSTHNAMLQSMLDLHTQNASQS